MVVQPGWREWVTGCSLALAAGIAAGSVRVDVAAPAPAVAPPAADSNAAVATSPAAPVRLRTEAAPTRTATARIPARRTDRAPPSPIWRATGKQKKHGHHG